MSKIFKTNAGPRAKFDWKFGIKYAVIDGLAFGTAMGLMSYLNQRIGFFKGAKAQLDGSIEQMIKIKE